MSQSGDTGASGGVVKGDPAIMTMTAAPTASAGEASHTLANGVVIAANGLMDVLNTVVFIDGASHLATALDEFGTGVKGALACYGTGLTVIASGLRVAATAFASTDTQLAAMFKTLDAQLPAYEGYATTVTLPTASTSQVASLNTLGAAGTRQTFQTTTISLSGAMQQSQGGGFSFSSMFHSVTHTIGNWASSAGHATSSFLENDLGAPPVIGSIGFVAVAGLVWVAAGGGAAAAAA